MIAALGWGALAASSLVLGAFLGLVRGWSDRLVGVVLAFGAGALISAVSFDLAEEGAKFGGRDALAFGLAAGALLVMLIDSMIPDAVRKGGDVSGLVTVLGFAVAAALSAS